MNQGHAKFTHILINSRVGRVWLYISCLRIVLIRIHRLCVELYRQPANVANNKHLFLKTMALKTTVFFYFHKNNNYFNPPIRTILVDVHRSTHPACAVRTPVWCIRLDAQCAPRRFRRKSFRPCRPGWTSRPYRRP